MAALLIGKSVTTWRCVTGNGAADRDDGAERTAVFKGNRLDMGIVQRVRVVGVLAVFDHKPAEVNRVFVPGWVRVRVQ